MNKKRKIIFLVDDSATSLNMGRDVLSEIYSVYTCKSGELMFEALENVTPDLILLDVEMPEMDGYEVIQRLKNNVNTKDIPVIFLTALDSDENELRGFSMGAIDYISKSFSSLRLLKRIEVHLELDSYKNDLEKLVTERTQEVVNLKNIFINTMAEIVEHRDTITGGHIDRIQRYIRIFICAMKENDVYDEETELIDVDLAVQSSQLHDIGKIAISDAILKNPEQLSPEEFDEIKQHTVVGEQIITQIQEKTKGNDFLEYAKVCALCHHEKWDGSGYPKGLKGDKIPLLGRVMAVVDVYDALVSARPYKDPFPHSEAVEIIKNDSGKHFDPILVNLFLDVHGEFEKIAVECEKSLQMV